MRTDANRNSRTLPGIIIAVSDYDRLVELAGATRRQAPQVASYLERELDRAEVVADDTVDRGVARVGSRVVYSDDQSGRQRTVTLAWPQDADVHHQRVSVLTSIGAALLGLRANQSIDWAAPMGGRHTLTVMAVHNDGDAPAAPPGAVA